MSLLFLLLVLSPVQADRYWDLDHATATALMERMEPGGLL